MKINPTSNFTSDQAVTSQLPTVPKRYKDTKIINIKSNIKFYMWPSSYQSVTYCYQRDIKTQKSSKINPTSNFTVTKQLPVSYLLLPKRCKDTKIIENESNIQNFTLTKQLPVSYLLLPKRYKGTKIIKNKSNIQFYKWPSSYQSVTYCYQRDIRTQKSLKINPTSNFTVTKQLPTVTKEI